MMFIEIDIRLMHGDWLSLDVNDLVRLALLILICLRLHVMTRCFLRTLVVVMRGPVAIPFLSFGLDARDVGHKGEIAVLSAVWLPFLHLTVRRRNRLR